MDAKAVDHAMAELNKATNAISRMENAKDFDTAHTEWTVFLWSTSRIYTKLEQGAKSDSKSVAWFRRKKRERKTDPLLCYLHHARNADEHGIERVTETHEGSFSIGGGGHYRFDGVISPEDTNLKVTHLSGEPPIFSFIAPHLRLISVTDRGCRYDPPKSHLGKNIEDQSPIGAGKLAILFFETIIADARKLLD